MRTHPLTCYTFHSKRHTTHHLRLHNVTILWGITYVVEFAIRLVMVYTMPIAQFLAISPFIFYGLTIVVIYATVRYGQVIRKRGEQRRQQLQKEVQP